MKLINLAVWRMARDHLKTERLKQHLFVLAILPILQAGFPDTLAR